MKHHTQIYLVATIIHFLAMCGSSLAQTNAKPTPSATIPLWPDKAPIGNGEFEKSNLKLEVFLPPADKATGTAIVLCPGGGYIRHVTDREGYPIAQWLNEHGIATIILEYRLPKQRHQVPLLDAQRAIRLTRANAEAWKLDQHRIGILGFSAGGHVASTAATHFDDGDAKSSDPAERLSCRPDFVWLVYPVVTMGKYTHSGSKSELIGANANSKLVRLYSNEKQVTAKTPPTFLAHAVDDKPVPPENSRQFVAALKTHRVPVELLELPSGGHGLNGCKGPLWEQWKAAALNWLSSQRLASISDQNRALIERASSLELQTQSTPPPGDPLEHHAAGFAKVLCSAVFVTGLDPEFAAESIGYFTAPYEERSKLKWRVDRKNKSVHVTMPNGVTRTAKFIGDLGCLTLPRGRQTPYFEPPSITSNLPDADTTNWPIGDVLPDDDFPSSLDAKLVSDAVDAAFEPPESLTAAFVVTWKGRIIGERYREGITLHTPLESWSMGKSLTATLMGTLIKDDVYSLDQFAPVPEWQKENDPRRKIRIQDILRMSSGLRFRAPADPDFDLADGYPDHRYVYTGTVNSFKWAVNRPLQWAPNTIGRYRNSDPVTTNYLIRLAVEKRGQDYHSFPQRAIFDKLGMRDMVLETDPYGNFLLQGYEFGAARDWSRLGNLYLQDGVWNGERLLPEGFVKFVSTLAPAWVADGRPIYGGFFWINGTKRFPIPKDAYYMAGAGGQYTIIIPSHDLVVVRMGHYKGSGAGFKALQKSLELLMNAIPKL